MAVPPGNTVFTANDPNWKFLPSISEIKEQEFITLWDILSAAILPPITVGNIGWLAILVYIWALLKRSQCHCRPGWVIQFSIAWNKVWTQHKNYQLRWHNLHIVLRFLLGKARCPCGFRNKSYCIEYNDTIEETNLAISTSSLVNTPGIRTYPFSPTVSSLTISFMSRSRGSLWFGGGIDEYLIL